MKLERLEDFREGIERLFNTLSIDTEEKFASATGGLVWNGWHILTGGRCAGIALKSNQLGIDPFENTRGRPIVATYAEVMAALVALPSLATS